MMVKIAIVLTALLLLGGCGDDTDEWVEVLKTLENDCAGQVTTIIRRSEWNTFIEVTCVEDRSK